MYNRIITADTMIYSDKFFTFNLTGKIFLAFFIFAVKLAAADYYVATTGNDSSAGTFDAPWKTIQHAADNVSAGDVVYIREGTYGERVSINVSGSEYGYVTFKNYDGESVVIDGSGLTPTGGTALLSIENQNYIIIQGLELRNYSTSDKNIVVMGIFIAGTSHHIQLLDNYVHNIEHNAESSGGNAHGIAVYGTNGGSSINNLVISGNTVADCKLGSSEALVLNGNVERFVIMENSVHDCDNIGIDLIGWEKTAPANDQARNGTVAFNTVYNISSYGNPAYGNEYAAGGIYVDGGKDIIIECNAVHHCDFGVEVGCEHRNKTTSGVVVRNNIFYLNNTTGIAFGGYSTGRGITLNCTFIHNTLLLNDTTKSGTGEIMIQKSHNNTVSNNIIYCNDQGIAISNYFSSRHAYDNSFDYNMYYCKDGKAPVFIWQKKEYAGFDVFRAASNQDRNSSFADPLFMDISAFDLRLQADSPAVNAGDPDFTRSGLDTDFAGDSRIVEWRTDCGAYEYNPGIPTYLLAVAVEPEVGGTVTGAGIYTEGETVSLTASPVRGYAFSEWAGVITGSDNPVTVIMDSDKTVSANFIEAPVAPFSLARGMVFSLASAEADAELSEFTRRPKVYAAYDNGNAGTVLKVLNAINKNNPSATVNLELNSALQLYDKKEFKNALISDKLKDDPMPRLEFDGLFVSTKSPEAGIDIKDRKLEQTVYLEPPAISGVNGNYNVSGDQFTVKGSYFGSILPKIYIEYFKNGDTGKPGYKQCKLDKSLSLLYKDASGKANKSCMVVLNSDSTDTQPVGYSQVKVIYPKLNSKDTVTGYIVIDNGSGLAVYKLP